MKIVLIGFALILILLYLVMLYSILVMSARSDKAMYELMEKELAKSNEKEEAQIIMLEKE